MRRVVGRGAESPPGRPAPQASTIPAFAKRGDLLVVDDGASFALQSGAHLSRASVAWFRHNDVAHLEAVLARCVRDAGARGGALNRRFILVEGLYASHGDVAPLAAISALAARFKFRLLVDETLALGALPGGRWGRGAAEAAGLPGAGRGCGGEGDAPGAAASAGGGGAPLRAPDIITGSLGATLGGVGGFCVGSREVVAHQRLNAAGYVFSASLPPYLAAGALAALRLLERLESDGGDAGPRARLAANAARLRAGVAALPGVALPLAGHPSVPLLHLRAARPLADPGEELARLERVCGRARRDGGVLVATAKHSVVERAPPPPSLRLAVSCAHTAAQVDACVAALARALAEEGVT